MIFVSGGTGFVGSHSVKRLAGAGHKLRLLTFSGKGLAAGLPEDSAEFVTGAITRPGSLAEKMEGCDIVINFVGIIVEVRGATFERIHVDGVDNLLEEAKKAGVKRFIHISALGTSEEPASEYFRTKWLGEELIKNSKIPYVILRPSLVFGPEDKFFNLLKPMLHSPIVPVVGPGQTKFQPIWVEDIASCVLKAVEDEKPLNGTWEIAGPHRFTFDKMLDRMADALGVSRRRKVHIPVRVVGPFVALGEALLPRPVLTADQLKMLSIDNTTDSNAITQVFGVKPHSFRRTVEEYWRP
jgi:NADH dehydrogenase